MKNRLKKLILYILFRILKLYVSLLFIFSYIKIDVSKESAEVIKKQPCILLFWHDRLLLFPHLISQYYKRKGYAIVSSHKDGKYLIDFLSVYGHKAIAGSSNRNPMTTLRTALSLLKKGDIIAITPDGPRGPRHKLKSNVIALAKICKVPIILCSYVPSYAKIFNSWDKFILPIPFLTRKIFIEIMPPIDINKLITEYEVNNKDDGLKLSKAALEISIQKNVEKLMNEQIKRLTSYLDT